MPRWILYAVSFLGACGSVQVDPPDADFSDPPDAAPIGATDATVAPAPMPDAAPAPVPVRRWYKLADGVEHAGPVPGLTPSDGPGPEAAFAPAEGFVHVAWCNAPGVEATVCQWDLPAASTRAQAWSECDAEAREVCGAIGFPQVLFY